uniref:Putative RING finger E3 ubiquitin ligase n=1 Tax=Marseillevirus LCMAC102 TaxID=2506603 RepID=A0A481YTF6_9VIRU|nr:MAG: putative RING finger E3 ubiquitin ligase [Marseillevirus LCMAC102]
MGGECSICLDSFNYPRMILIRIAKDFCPIPILNDESVYQLNCGHTFHKKCIIKWLREHNTCPLCRRTHKDGTIQLIKYILVVVAKSLKFLDRRLEGFDEHFKEELEGDKYGKVLWDLIEKM